MIFTSGVIERFSKIQPSVMADVILTWPRNRHAGASTLAKPWDYVETIGTLLCTEFAYVIDSAITPSPSILLHPSEAAQPRIISS